MTVSWTSYRTFDLSTSSLSNKCWSSSVRLFIASATCSPKWEAISPEIPDDLKVNLFFNGCSIFKVTGSAAILSNLSSRSLSRSYSRSFWCLSWSCFSWAILTTYLKTFNGLRLLDYLLREPAGEVVPYPWTRRSALTPSLDAGVNFMCIAEPGVYFDEVYLDPVLPPLTCLK